MTTLASRRDEIAKSTGADSRDKIVVAPLSVEVPFVFGVDLSNLSYVAAMVWKKSEAVPQLVSRPLGAKHVFEVGESMCLRHGRVGPSTCSSPTEWWILRCWPPP